jgi:hypothetical protein
MRDILEVVTYRPGEFGGRGNWINPLIWLGVPFALLGRARIARFWPLVLIALVEYETWIRGTQVIRLLLPAAALLSIPAADALMAVSNKFRAARYGVG